MAIIHINGLLREKDTQRPMPGMYVEIYGSGTPVNQQFWVGGGKSDEDGSFSIFLREDTYPAIEVPSPSNPLTLVVFYGDHVIHTESITSVYPDIQVPTQHYNFYYYYYYGNGSAPIDPTHGRTEDLFFVIEGQVTDRDGRGISYVRLNAYAKGFRSKNIICRAYPDVDGFYSMKIAFLSLEAGWAKARNLVIEVDDGWMTALAESRDILEFPSIQRVDLQLDHESLYLSDYDELYNRIFFATSEDPWIFPFTEFATITTTGDNRESQYIARAINRDEASVIAFVRSWARANDEGWAYSDVHIGAFFAILKAGVIDDRDAIFSLSRERLTEIWNDAIQKKIISDYIEAYIPTLLLDFGNVLGNITADVEIEEEGITLSDYFSGVYIEDTFGDYLQFLSTYEGDDVTQFWDSFRISLEDSGYLADELQRKFQIAAITGYQPAMANELDTHVDGHVWVAAKLDIAGWTSMINTAGGSSAVPRVIFDHSSTPVEDYAERLKFISQDTFPGGALVGQLQGPDGYLLIPDAPTRWEVDAFLSTNPHFDFRTASVDDINAENYDLSYVSDVNVVIEALIPFQAVSRIANARVDAVTAMMLDGLNSAGAVMTLSADVFVNQYSVALGGNEQARGAYNLAGKINGLSVATATDFSLIGNGPSWTWTVNPVDPAVANPDLSTLFGSLEQCGCAECMSVYSAGAYFVDILNFIKQKGDADENPYKELTRRRPDLEYIDITCKNANTVLPYIDLLNERLEVLILEPFNPPPTPPPPPPPPPVYDIPNSYQTTGTAANLAAYPEHMKRTSGDNHEYVAVYENVYDDILKNAIYPLNLPFNLPLEEARVYLQHLGYSRLRLMDLLRPMGGSVPDTGITDYNYYTESAGMSKEMADIISTPGAPDLYPFYGFDNDNPVVFLSPTDSSQKLTGAWDELLRGDISGANNGGLDVLLYVLDISFKELMQLLYTDTLNKEHGGTRYVDVYARDGEPLETCVLRELRLRIIGGYSDDFFDKLHRFVRLWKATGIGIYELDVLLRAFGVEDISNIDALYKNLMRAIHLARKLNIPVECFATWWAVMDTNHYVNYNSDRQDPLPSVYDRFFRSKSNPRDTTFDLSQLTSKKYGAHLSGIIAACRISEEDLKLLMGLKALNISLEADMTLVGLTQIFGVATVCNALKIKAQDFIRFCQLCKIDYGKVLAAPTATHADTQMGHLEQLLSYAEMLGSSGFSLDDVRYMLLDKDEQKIYTPEEKVVQPFYEGVRAELQKEYVDTSALSPLTDADKIKAIKDMLKNIIIQHYAAQFSIQADTVVFLLKDLFEIGYDHTGNGSYTGKEVLDALIDPDFIFSEYDFSTGGIEDAMSVAAPGKPYVNLFHLYPLYYRMNKMALLFTLTGVRKEEIRLLQEYCDEAELDVPDLCDYPYTGEDDITEAKDLFVRLMRYIRWVTARRRLALTPELLRQLAETTLTGTKAQWVALVVQITQWADAQVTDLVGAVGTLTSAGILQVAFRGNFKDPYILLRMADIFAASAKIGLLPQQINDVLQSNLVMTDARRVRMAARSKYDEAAWMKVAKPLQDPLREKQRKAMVSYLLTKPDKDKGKIWRTENDLYAWLLMDVEMQPCTMTSRIRLALSSVQLYMDRVIMNLEYYKQDITEPLVKLAPADITQWKSWRKWYRIWEANRKVFLYPENWIEPELRDNKTPFFKDLETQLLQDELNETTANNAYLAYLEKLDEVARLEPVTAYHEKDRTAGIDVLHVVSRTYGDAPVYYYRKFVDGEWTAWEPMNIEPKSDHITLVVWNRRLIVLWLDFMEKQLDDASGRIYIRQLAHRRNTEYNNGIGTWSNTVVLHDPMKFNHILDIGYGNRFPVLWMRDELVDISEGLYNNDMSKEDAQGKLLKGWGIRINWSEYKDRKWTAPQIGSDVMEMYPWAFRITKKAELNLQGTYVEKWKAISDLIRKQKDLSVNDLFKNRMYLYPTFGPNNSLVIQVMVAAAFDELATNIYTFRFDYPGADPITVRNVVSTQIAQSMMSPANTVMNLMKFVETPYGSYGHLAVSEYKDKPGQDRSYYPIGGTDSLSGYSDREEVTSGSIFGNTPNGPFRITAKANMDWGRNPLYNHFFFEDDKHLFFLYRESVLSASSGVNSTMSQPALTSVAQLASSYQSNFVGPATGQAGAEGTDGVSFPTSTAGRYNTPKPVYHVRTFYHAHVNKFIRELNLYGIDGLLKINMQVQTDTMDFDNVYDPSELVHLPYPTDKVAFDYSDAYSTYNWELFYHIPMLIAQRLSENQQFEQAQKWYHYVFDPTNNTDASGSVSTTKQRFWKCRPLYDQAGEKIETLTDMMAYINKYSDQVTKWEKNPFSPHVIARMRLLAYMKNTVMKYLDNLIAWGDQLFRRDTIESLNEATQLYILASNILGRRPESMPALTVPVIQNFIDLDNAGLDRFSNAAVKIERFIGRNVLPTGGGSGEVPKMKYFCLPQNDKLMGYWDTVADRLFKIRNCMNIEGVIRQLPLFDPPIDPAMLVRAAAAGIDTGAVMDSIAGIGMPHYRFSYIVQKANEVCADVKALGAALLAALEKKDAEGLALLRSGHEIKLLEQVKTIREAQVQESEQTIEALKKTREVTDIRYKYYTSRVKMNTGEQQHLKSLEDGLNLQIKQTVTEGIAGALALIPNIHLQVPGAGTSIGGMHFSTMVRAAATVLNVKAVMNNAKGSMALTKAGYERRQDDWDFQAESALKELEQIDKQIIGAEIRLSIAQKELDSQTMQIENSRETDAYMRSKYTNQELYNWMIGQIATVYFQSYQLAFDIAKKAEMCFTQELPEPLYKMPAKGLIQFGYWDSLRKGLMSGEKLQYDLRKMEAVYIENNKRQLEMTKHVSLALLDAEALLSLKNNGTCHIDIPEALFDLDYPGQYMRRIKSVSISIPCVTGPYTTVSCMLFQTSSKYRWDGTNPGSTAGYPETGVNDQRFKKFTGGDSVATSSAQNDNGVFELNFRDERYLPFEGSGAISNWTLVMPSKNRQFDYDTIQDVIIHIKYTAEYNSLLKGTVENYLEELLADPDVNYPAFFSLKHDFPDAWAAGFEGQVIPPVTGQGLPLTIPVSRSMYPEYAQRKEIGISKLIFVLRPGILVSTSTEFYIQVNNETPLPLTYLPQPAPPAPPVVPYMNETAVTVVLPEDTSPEEISLKLYKKLIPGGENPYVEIAPEDIQDFFMITVYSLTEM